MSGPFISQKTDAETRKFGDHPLFGCMQGTIIIPDGVDLTEPAFPEWADLIDEFLDETMRQCRSQS